ncbi:hypothetical protein CLCR_07811 [Cladophialophora carrionii]|uniref:Uncharacterized protein n=1 Tax=Cladophialophora carrionii TaxID=86049 RepID=A0A1C1CPW4_9EURO|nr:hypothetical protein CLCR_07811 [Cladophialophora carrionii]
MRRRETSADDIGDLTLEHLNEDSESGEEDEESSADDIDDPTLDHPSVDPETGLGETHDDGQEDYDLTSDPYAFREHLRSRCCVARAGIF